MINELSFDNLKNIQSRYIQPIIKKITIYLLIFLIALFVHFELIIALIHHPR